MGLDRVHVGGAQPGRGQGLADHPFLRRAVRGGQPVRRAILVDRAAPDHRQHPVPVLLRVRQPLQQHQPHALRQAGAVGARAERLAPAIGGQALLPAELGEHGGRGHHGDAAGQGQVTFAAAQCLGGQVHGDQ